MILTARKHLFAINIISFIVIYVVQKCIKFFCIIEQKACDNVNCNPNNRCNDGCIKPIAESTPAAPAVLTPPAAKDRRLIPLAMGKTMRNFGYGEGHYQMFVEKKQRKQSTSKACLNAAVAEVKLNPN